MRRTRLIVLALIFTSIGLQAQDGLIAYYPFNGNAQDESGSGLHGVNSGATLTMDRFGNVNSAYSFNGVDNYIDIQSNTLMAENSAKSVVLWLKAPSGILSEGQSYLRSMVDNSPAGYGRFFNLRIIDGEYNIAVSANQGTTNSFILQSGPVDPDRWVCAAFSWEPNRGVHLYLDGVFRDSTAIIPSWESISGHSYIGRQYQNPEGHYFSGSLDDIRMYDRMITAEEVVALYHEAGWDTDNRVTLSSIIPSSAVLADTVIIYCKGQSESEFPSYSVFVNGQTAEIIELNQNYIKIITPEAEPGLQTVTINVNGVPQITTLQFEVLQASQMEFDLSEELVVGSGPRAINTVDLNSDGHLDVIVTNGVDNTISIFLTDVSSDAMTAATYNTGIAPSGIAFGDIDHDGDVDISVSNQTDNSVSVFQNIGNGTFLDQVVYAVGVNVMDCVMADLDQDGDVDIASVQGTTDNVSILFNQGDGSFASAINHPVAGSNYSIVVDDLDGDGLLDIITSNGSSWYISILYNLGNGNFAAYERITAGDGCYNVEVGDLNHDGKPDLITSNHRGNSISVLINLGNRMFATPINYPASESSWGLDLGDINGDGALDLAVVSRTLNTVSIHENSDVGEFSAGISFPVDENPRHVHLADLNNDGRLDMLVTNEGANSLSIFFQRTETRIVVDNVAAQVNDTYFVPIFVHLTNGRAIELDFSGYSEGLEFVGIDTVGSLISGLDWTWAENEVDGVLHTAFAGSDEISGEGIFCYLEFLVTGEICTSVPVNCDFALINDAEVTDITNGSFHIEPTPDVGDVDENDTIQALDASDILIHLLDDAYLGCQGLANADTYFDGAIDAMDAAMILRYIVELEDALPVIPSEMFLAAAEISTEDQNAVPGSIIQIPLNIDNGQNIYAFEGTIIYDPEILTPDEDMLSWSSLLDGFMISTELDDGLIKFVGASSASDGQAGVFAMMNFTLNDGVEIGNQTTVSLESIKFNSNLIIEDVSAIVSSVVSVDPVSIPTEYVLQQNYPNPFNPSTTISYGLPAASEVSIIIYDVQGREVTNLIQTGQEAGWHEAIWNGMNSSHARVSTGVYFARLHAGDYSKVIKMVYLR